MAKIYGALFINPEQPEDPIVFVPSDGSNAQLNLINELPTEVAQQLSDQADALELTPLGVIVDLS